MDALRELARIDTEISVVTRRLDPFRARHAHMASEAAVRQKELQALEVKLATAVKACRAGERAIQELEEKRKAETKKLDHVSSSREAKAVEHELEILATRMRATEDATIEKMEEQEKIEQELQVIKIAAGQAARELATLEADMASAETDLKRITAERAVERQAALDSLSPDIRKVYLSLTASGKVRDPIMLVQEESCPGCQAFLKPNIKVQLRSNKPAVCDQCHRILIPEVVAGL